MQPDFDLIQTVADTFSISQEMTIAGLILTTLLLLFAAGVVVHVVLVSHDRKISIRSAMKYALSAIWAIPVLAMLAAFGYRTTDYLQRTHEQAQSVDRSAEEPVADRSSDRPAPKFVPEKPAPEWTKFRQPGPDEVVTTASGDLDVIVARGADVADAERKLVALARKRLVQHARSHSKAENDVAVLANADDRAIRIHAVKDRFEQPGTETVHIKRPGTADKVYSNKVYQVYWKLDFSQQAREDIRQTAALPRVWILGGLVGLLTLIAVAIATYLRLDARTEGKYRLQLKSATTVFVVAAGLLVTALLPLPVV